MHSPVNIAKSPILTFLREAVFPRLHLVLIYIVVGTLLSFVWTVQEVMANRYVSLGFWRTIFLIAHDRAAMFGAASSMVIISCVVLRSSVASIWPRSGHYLSPSFLVCCVIEFRLRIWLYAACILGCCALYIAQGHSKRVALVTFLCCALIAGLAMLAKRYTDRSGPRLRAFVAASFSTGLALIVAGYVAMDTTPVFQLFALQSIVVNLCLIAMACVHFMLVRFHVLRTSSPGRNGDRPSLGRPVLLLTLAGCIPLAALWATSLYFSQTTIGAKNARNVIIIGIDTLRADHTSLRESMGRDLTPNLRNLAEQGTIFQTAISQAPWTMPAFASILTGKYPHEHGAISLSGYLGDDQVTLAEVLREAGYYTGAVVSHIYVDSARGFAQGFDEFNEEYRLGHRAITSEGVTSSALEFLEEHGDERFFLFLHYFDPHYEYRDHEAYSFSENYSGWLRRDDSNMEINTLRKKRHLLESADLEYLVDLYDEEIAYTDAQIGRLLQGIRQNGLGPDTAIVVVADHGEEFMERGWLGHTISLYDEQIKVPLICVLPGLDPGQVVSDVVETRHIFSMILQYLDLFYGKENLPSPLLTKIERSVPDRESPEAYSIVWLPDAPPDSGKRVRIASLRTDEWKLILDYTRGTAHLFNIRDDPLETNNLALHAQEEMQAMRERLNAWVDQMTKSAVLVPRKEMDEGLAEELEALGYL